MIVASRVSGKNPSSRANQAVWPSGANEMRYSSSGPDTIPSANTVGVTGAVVTEAEAVGDSDTLGEGAAVGKGMAAVVAAVADALGVEIADGTAEVPGKVNAGGVGLAVGLVPQPASAKTTVRTKPDSRRPI